VIHVVEIVTDSGLVARCGLYCGACGRYLKEKCPGCAGNEGASWCKVRSCTMEKGHASCAECSDFERASDCKNFNNIFSKLMALVFRSNRQACIDMIKEKGYEDYAAHMAENGLQSLKR
jgi:hypothetical protein